MTAPEPGPRRWAAPVATCGACGRQRPCYHAKTQRPLCRSCYRRENKHRWKIAPWSMPVAVCSRCASEGPAWFAKTDAPLCDACHTKQRARWQPPTLVAVSELCGRQRDCQRGVDGRVLCSTCVRGGYRRDWTPPIATCLVCARERPCFGARADRPVCPSCRRRELRTLRPTPYRLPVAVCSDCGVERPCHLASSDRPRCPPCRWRGHKPREWTCSVCGRHRPCQNAGTDRAICRTCRARRTKTREQCASCGQLRGVYHRARDQPECERCARTRMRQRITCQRCARALRPAATDPDICEYCAGEAALHGCRRCGEQAPNYEHGRCPDCALAVRISALRQTADPAALATLEPYLAALAASPSAWGTVRWLRQSPAAPNLERLLAGTLEISHEALDDLDEHQSTLRLRDQLVATGVLPARLEQTAAFARALPRLLARVADAEQRTRLRAFATWQLQHQLLRRERRDHTTRHSADHEIQLLRSAVALTTWALERGLTLATLTQPDLDAWVGEAPSAHSQIRDFLKWSRRAGVTASTLTVPARTTRRHTDELPDPDRLALARRLLDDPTIDLRDRVTGLLIVLLAQPIARLVTLTADHVNSDAQRVTIRLGRDPLELPDALATLVAQLADQARHHTQHGQAPRTPWLFPGLRLDQPMTAKSLRRRLQPLGVPALPARTGALLALAALPPAILADLLGISEHNASRWSRLAAGDWNRYAANASRRYQHANT